MSECLTLVPLVCVVLLCWYALSVVRHLSVHRFSEAERERNNVLQTFERLFEKKNAPPELAYPLHATHSQERQAMTGADLERSKLAMPIEPHVARESVDVPNTEFMQ